jgi:hypothetical protein
LAVRAYAVTDTPTETPTVTPSATLTITRTATPTFSATPTATATPGDGRWSFAPSSQPFVTGNVGYTGVLTYKNGPSAWPASGGLLTVFFPLGLDAPTSSNFFAVPAYAAKVLPTPDYSGQTAKFLIKDLAPGDSISFYYGYNATGLAVTTTSSPLTFQVAANSQDGSSLGGLVTPNAGQDSVAVVTPTMTPTITTTFTISPTITLTPTITFTCTITPTWTESPIGVEQIHSVYSYPNPYDMKKFDKCTFRFPNAASAQVTVFNLVGEPVREIPSGDINAGQGWAVWPGVDDYLRKVTGGLYFVRVRTPNETVVKKFTVLH